MEGWLVDVVTFRSARANSTTRNTDSYSDAQVDSQTETRTHTGVMCQSDILPVSVQIHICVFDYLGHYAIILETNMIVLLPKTQLSVIVDIFINATGWVSCEVSGCDTSVPEKCC